MIEFNFEAKRRLRAGFVGAGLHAYRNVYPAFRYAPVDLVAVADHHPEKASAFARLFGAERWYTDHQAMLERERLDAVFLCLNFDAEGYPRYPRVVLDALAAGCHVWMEKPPAATTSEVDAMRRAADTAGRYVAVGYKKMFFPTYERVGELIRSGSLGHPTSASMRYRLSLPPADQRDNQKAWAGFMDLCHPASALHALLGPVEELTFRRTGSAGGVGALLRHASGVVTVLHLTGGQAPTSPLERLEIVGEGANVVVENCARLLHYRSGGTVGTAGYGRSPTFIGSDDSAPVIWEPEFSLGQLYNNSLFLEGYAQQVRYFCDCVLDAVPPTRGSLDDAWHLTRLFEAFKYGEEGLPIRLSALTPPAREVV